jgi:cell division transport system ATP-binding protein
MEVFPFRGTVRVANYDSHSIHPKEIPFFRRKVGMVFQDFKLLEDRNVCENVAFALWATGVPRRKIRKRVFQVLADVGLSHKRNSMIHELSGGEQQRVAIARAMANEPFVLLADEPTGNLDAESSHDLIRLLNRISTRGTAVVMTTHREDLVGLFPNRIVRICEGKFME